MCHLVTMFPPSGLEPSGNTTMTSSSWPSLSATPGFRYDGVMSYDGMMLYDI